MVINGSSCDRKEIIVQGNIIQHCIKYVYLGAVIHEEATFAQFMKEHTDEKYKNLLKLYAFLGKNSDLPFQMKRKVLEACLISTVLYSSESWFSDRLGKLNPLYMSAQRASGWRSNKPSRLLSRLQHEPHNCHTSYLSLTAD